MNIHTEELEPSSSKSRSDEPGSQLKSEYLRKSSEQPYKEECSVRLFNEFMNCESFLFTMQERENLESISSDGELNDFKRVTIVD